MRLSFQRFFKADSASSGRRKARGSKSRLPQRMPLELQSLEPRLALAVADTIAPTVKSIAAPLAKTYAAGSTLSFKATFTEKVFATGVPTLPITIGDTVRQATWNGKGSGGKSLVFTTRIQSGDLAPSGVSIAGPVGLSGGAAIRDKAGNSLIPAATGAFPKAKVDAVGPRVVEFGDVTVTPKLISLRVTFTEPVAVKGKPSIPFYLAGASKRLVYSRGSGTNVLTFSYKPAKGEAPTGANVNVPTQAISLGSAGIADKVRNVATSLAQPDVKIRWVKVGDKGNAADDTGYGAVAYEYRIGTYEVTIGQYTKFLNAVAATDTYSLYNTRMTQLSGAGISRAGSNGSYTYSVMNNGGNSSNRPITWVSWFDAARFANWMHNGQPAGPQNATATEDGAYTLNGATSGNAPAKNAGARFYIPTENEWYKAAYYKGGSTNAGYWDYATRSDSAPGNTIGSGANQANYRRTKVFAVTQSSEYTESQNYLTDVGVFTNSASSYGTFDQSGNALEWNDLTGAPFSVRGLLGGNWGDDAVDLSSSWAGQQVGSPSDGNARIGFRLASPV